MDQAMFFCLIMWFGANLNLWIKTPTQKRRRRLCYEFRNVIWVQLKGTANRGWGLFSRFGVFTEPWNVSTPASLCVSMWVGDGEWPRPRSLTMAETEWAWTDVRTVCCGSPGSLPHPHLMPLSSPPLRGEGRNECKRRGGGKSECHL